MHMLSSSYIDDGDNLPVAQVGTTSQIPCGRQQQIALFLHRRAVNVIGNNELHTLCSR